MTTLALSDRTAFYASQQVPAAVAEHLRDTAAACHKAAATEASPF